MKKLPFLLFAALSTTPLFAQIQLEHTYPSGQVWRTRLDVSGETYAHGHTFGCNVALHDAAHAEKTFLEVNAGTECSGYQFSEKIMDGDAGVELLYYWLDGGFGLAAGSTFRDDNGSQTPLGNNSLQLSRPPGLPVKMLIGASVRSLPGLQIEHSYGNNDWRVERHVFPSDGERYLAYNFKNFDGFHFHDAQHMLLKTVNLPHPGFNYLTHVSQQTFNADAQFEFFGSRWTSSADANGNRRRTEVLREDGSLLFSMPSENASLSQLPGHPDRLLVYGYGSPQQRQTTVVDPATLTVLHTLPGSVSRMTLPDGEAIYWEYIVGSKALIYNAQFQLLKTVELPNSYALSITRGQFSKEKKFDAERLECAIFVSL
jgi:hypothetical protein